MDNGLLTPTLKVRRREVEDGVGLEPGEPLQCVLTLVEAMLALPVVIAQMGDGLDGCCWRDGDRVLLVYHSYLP